MNNVLFVALPYVAWTLAILGGLYRYLTNRFSFSSLSSELLEKRTLFWGSVAWHYGIIPVLLAHLALALFPAAAIAVLGDPARRLVVEVVGLALGLFALFGLLALIVRRMPRRSLPRAVTSPMDWILLAVLLLQVASGVSIALFQRWGSMWYTGTAVPWFWSIATLRPDPSAVAVMPPLVRFHFATGFIVILLFPFTRLVHLVSVPLTYLWRPSQVVVWNRRPGARKIGGVPRSLGAAAARELPTDGERRRFLNRLSIALVGVAGLVVGAPSAAFLLGLRKVQPVWIRIGALDQFQPGTTTLVAISDPTPLPWAGVTARTAAWVRREQGDRFIAFSVNCTHLGCPVRWLPDADLFMCPCHGGVFYSDGQVASGPPGRRLSQYPVRVHGGAVEILASPLPIT